MDISIIFQLRKIRKAIEKGNKLREKELKELKDIKELLLKKV